MASPRRMSGRARVEKIRSSGIFIFLEFAIVGMATLQMVFFLYVNSSSYISGNGAALYNLGQNKAGFEPPSVPFRQAGAGAGAGFGGAGGDSLRGFNKNAGAVDNFLQPGAGSFGGAGAVPPRGYGENTSGGGFNGYKQGDGSRKGAESLPKLVAETFGITKRLEGGYRNSWVVVNWEDPISAEDELRYSCDWMTFTTSSGMKTQICGRIDDDTLKCDYGKDFVDMMYEEEDSMELPFYLDIGSTRGACILEMLLETDVNIIAFEPHPLNIYSIRKTILNLDKSLQNRVLFYPVALASAASIKNIDISKKISDQGDIKVPVYLERLDSLLDDKKIKQNAIKLVHMDIQGLECDMIEGMGERLASKINLIKVTWHNYAQNCQNGSRDYLHELRRLGFGIWRKYNNGKFGAFVQGDSPPKFNGVDLWASKLEKIY